MLPSSTGDGGVKVTKLRNNLTQQEDMYKEVLNSFALFLWKPD